MFDRMPKSLSDHLGEMLSEGNTITSSFNEEGETHFIIEYPNLEDWLTIIHWNEYHPDPSSEDAWCLININADLRHKVYKKLSEQFGEM